MDRDECSHQQSMDHHNQDSTRNRDPGVAAPSAEPDADNGCFDCNICLGFAQDPVVTLCGHLYCWPCIYEWLNHKTTDGDAQQQCPVCKAVLSETMMVPLYGRGDGPMKIKADKNGPHSNVGAIPHRPSPCRGSHANAMTTQGSTMAQPTSITNGQYPPLQHHSHPRRRRWDPYFDDFWDDYTASPTLSFGGTTTGRVFHPSTTMMGSIGGTVFHVLPWVLGYRDEPGLDHSDPYYLRGSTTSDDRVQIRREAAAERSLRRISTFLLCCLIMCLLMF